jgi:murein DD-endopeptidase MepM/ murein hydrolase activator NlpD
VPVSAAPAPNAREHAPLLWLGAGTLAALWLLRPRSNDAPNKDTRMSPEPSERMKQLAQEAAAALQGTSSAAAWPVDIELITRVGDAVTPDRDGKGRPHYGLDLMAPAGTPVKAAQAGRVLRVIDGRASSDEKRRNAGLWVDVLGTDGLVYRYMHLGTASVEAEAQLARGGVLGTVAAAGESGSGKASHLHFEIRRSDAPYGDAINPLRMLPPRRS